MTPSVLTLQIEQIELVQEISNRPECKERILIKRSFVIFILRFQSSAPVIHNEFILTSSSSPSTITVGPNMTKSVPVESNRSSSSLVLHLTTAIDDDNEELFSTSFRKLTTIQVKII
jgi:hypothetical protein